MNDLYRAGKRCPLLGTGTIVLGGPGTGWVHSLGYTGIPQRCPVTMGVRRRVHKAIVGEDRGKYDKGLNGS